MPLTIYLGTGLGYLLAAFSLVPLFHQLRLSSSYEYLQLRFQSSAVRLLAVVFSMLSTLCFMALVLLSPALALQAGANFPLWLSIGIIGGIGTIYTTLGGIKGVIWTDAFQCLVMFAGVFTFLIKGTSIVGGGSEVWKIAQESGRASFTEFSPDPRVRNSWWGTVIGGAASCYAGLCTQQFHQRIASMKTLTDCRKAFLMNGLLFVFYGGLLYGMAIVVYAYFVYVRCDPYKAGFISNANQVSPYFVVQALRDLPGMGGVYLSLIFSGSLSTFSSGINALASNAVDDLLSRPLRSFTESTITLITKVIVFLFGLLTIGVSFGLKSLPGPLSQITVAILGACGGPILGVFLLGALVPWGNKFGALSGGLVALALNFWIVAGNTRQGVKYRVRPGPTMEMCQAQTVVTSEGNTTSSIDLGTTTSTWLNSSVAEIPLISRDPYSYGFFLYDISYQWYAFVGLVVSLLVGILISACTVPFCHQETTSRLLFPFIGRCQKVALPDDEGAKNSGCDKEHIQPEVFTIKLPRVQKVHL